MSMHQSFTCPQEVGTYEIYRMYHEEMESLVKHIPTIRRAQFWMSFSPNYLKHLEVLQNVGMTRIDPVMYNGVEIIRCNSSRPFCRTPGTWARRPGENLHRQRHHRNQGRPIQGCVHLQHLRP